jgi:ribosomal protein S18 acetylase RimI-like enzyme
VNIREQASLEVTRLLSDSYHLHHDDLVEIYKGAFEGPPYFEQFSSDDVRDILFTIVSNDRSMFLVGGINGKVVAFICGHPVEFEQEVLHSISNGFNPSRTYYHAEVAVHPNYQGRGFGFILAEQCFSSIPSDLFDSIVLRTSVSNVRSINLHRKLGFEILEGCTQIVENERVDGDYRGDERIFLYKHINI